MNVRKILALLLVVVMVLSTMAGCNQKAPEAEVAPTEGANNPTVAPEASDDAAEEEPVKLSIMVANLAEVPEGSVSELWQKQLEEKLNIQLEWVLPPTTAYEDNLQLALISEEKPDVFCFPTEWLNQASFLDACENGMFYDISGMLNDYPDLVGHTAEHSWDALDVFNDGRIWGVPRSTISRADGFAIRKDWLENLGIDYTEGEMLTLDEFYNILYRFTYDDPDGNGIDDTYGLLAYANADGSLNSGLAQIFHVGLSGNSWYELDDGTITNLKYSKNHDYYKQYLEFANKCWEAGVIEPDAFALDFSASWERLNSYGVYQSFPGNMFVEINEASARNTVDVYCPGVVVEGDPIGGYTYGDYSNGIWNYYAISTTCEHPEKVLELMNYILSDEQWNNLRLRQLEGVSYTIDENGVIDLSLSKALKEEDQKNGTKYGDESLLSLFLRRSDGAEAQIDYNWSHENQVRVAKLIETSLDLYWPSLDRGYQPAVTNDPIFIEYKNYLVQEESKIITGDSPVEYWDELLNGFYEAGYDEFTTEMISYIESFG